MKHVMLDLETMGLSTNAPIIAIGAVEFDWTSIHEEGKGLGREFYRTISLNSAMRHGAEPDASTILWWMTQSEEARKEFTKKNEIVSVADTNDIAVVLSDFKHWLTRDALIEDVMMWGNGATFDNAILATAYTKLNIKLPWGPFNDRCYRTLKSLVPDVKLIRGGTHHNALDDAKSQANHAIAIMWKLLGGADL